MNEDVGPAYWTRLWRWENVHYHILSQDPQKKSNYMTTWMWLFLLL